MKNYKSPSNFDGYSIKCYDKTYSLINFSPGPAPISVNVFNKVKEDIFNNSNYVFGNTPLEMSHRSPEFNEIINNVNKKIRNFMEIPDDFNIIWTQGGGHAQFSSIPLNMKTIDGFKKAAYLVTGTWSSRAFNESKKFIESENLLDYFYQNKQIIEYNKIPANFSIPSGIDYVYLCSNETVNGIEFKNYLNRTVLNGAKLFVDMSSDFLMKKIDWNNIDGAFACTSKNMGVAGANILIIRKNIIENLNNNYIPCVLDWKLYNDANSLYNTPAVFNIYLIEQIIDNYINEMQTIENMNDYSIKKSNIFYDFLDNNNLFHSVIKDKNSRSIVNIPFIVGDGDEKIMSRFLEYCYLNNIVGLRTLTPFSYKSLGLVEPLRVSFYNGISIDDVHQLIEIMKSFILIA